MNLSAYYKILILTLRFLSNILKLLLLLLVMVLGPIVEKEAYWL